jgi:DNA-binding response OmpR family regulator
MRNGSKRRMTMATILVIDDERLLCGLLQEMLSRHGHEVFAAYNGCEGVALYKQQRPCVTLLDLHLPDMNGVEVLRQIRGIDPKAAVSILTGSASDKLEREVRSLGVTDFLIKGLAPEDLLCAVTRAARQLAPDAALSLPIDRATSAPSGFSGAESILVVDDEPKICDMLKQYLTSRGFRVQTAMSGSVALDLAMSWRPQLIVLDIGMPDMNGIETLRKLRENGYRGGVMMLTGSHDDTLLRESLDLGSIDIVEKPVDLERTELAIQVGLILSNARPRAGRHVVTCNA